MSTVLELEKAVSGLASDQLAKFRAWFEKFDSATWDSQFEDDAKSGKLDKIAEQAIDDFKKGKCKEL